MSTKPLADQVMPGAGDAESARASEGAVRPRDSLFHWSGTADAISQTAKEADKRAILDAYFGAVAEETVEPAARYLSGRFFSTEDSRSTPISEAVVAEAIREVGRIRVADLRADAEGVDLAGVAATVFAGRLPSGLAVSEVAEWGTAVARSVGADAERELVREMLGRVSSLEARYLVKLITGKLGAVVDPTFVAESVERRRSLPSSARAVDRRKHKEAKVGPASPARRSRRRAP